MFKKRRRQSRPDSNSNSTNATPTTSFPPVSPLPTQTAFDLGDLPSPAFSRFSRDSLQRPSTSDGQQILLQARRSSNNNNSVSRAPPVLPPIQITGRKDEGFGSGLGLNFDGAADADAAGATEKQRERLKVDSGIEPEMSRRDMEQGQAYGGVYVGQAAGDSSKVERDDRVLDHWRRFSSGSRFDGDGEMLLVSPTRNTFRQEERHRDSLGLPTGSPSEIMPKPSPALEQQRPGPATSSAGTMPRMESSMFAAPPPSSSPALPPVDTMPAMSRAWIDARDKPYGQAQPRPPIRPIGQLQANHSSPDLLASASTRAPPPAPLNTTNISPPPNTTTTTQTRSPLSTTSDKPRRNPLQSFSSTPNSTSLPRPPSHYSILSKTSHTSPPASTPTITIGTPYQETSPGLPQPQHVATRPKTAGATATVAGVSVPTYYTSSFTPAGGAPRPSPPPRTETAPMLSVPHPPVKSEKRKTLGLLNPMAFLTRRKSSLQDEEALAADKAAQQRQRNVAAVGVSRLPEDFDPRIRGKVVHDFSAPRGSFRASSYGDPTSRDVMGSGGGGGNRTSSAPFVPALREEEQQERPGSAAARRHQSPRHGSDGSSNATSPGGARRTSHTPVFREHLSEHPEAAKRFSSIQAERLENKDFLQRASQQSTVSQESAVLPPFARRSQAIDPMQTSFLVDDSSTASSGKAGGNRDSGASSGSGVSPITTRNSAFVQRQSLPSPVSPASPGALGRPESNERPVSALSGAEMGVRPISSHEAQNPQKDAAIKHDSALTRPAVEPIVEEPTPKLTSDDNLVPTIPQRDPARQGPPPGLDIPPRMSSATPSASITSSALPSPSLHSSTHTPEPLQIAHIGAVAPKSPPRLVEKRASAVGHAKRSSATATATPPKHHVSNASRFSFQFGASAAEELGLEEKARLKYSSGLSQGAAMTHGLTHGGGGGGGGGGEDEDDDFFDEDAIDDLDEREMEERGDELPPLNREVDSFEGMRNVTPEKSMAGGLATHSTYSMSHARRQLQFDDDDDRSYDGESEDDVDRRRWTSDSLQSYGNGGQASGSERASSGLRLDTSVADQSRSGFYMQPVAAGYSPTTRAVSQPVVAATKPPLPLRASGNSEQNRVASGLDFASGPHSYQASFANSTDGSLVSSRRATQDGAAAAGLGLSGFSDFKFVDSSPEASRPNSMPPSKLRDSATRGNRPTSMQRFKFHDSSNEVSRPTSMQQQPFKFHDSSAEASRPTSIQHPALGRRESRRQDSETIPQFGQFAPFGNQTNGHQASSSKVSRLDVDDMYFDDGGFGEDVDDSNILDDSLVDEDAFDDDSFLNGADRVNRSAPVQHQRDASALSTMSLGSDGPYPSFAMPHPAKARARDSQMLLEDIALEDDTAVDPMLIPRRNPSEDAKRLGLSSKAPPLPLPQGTSADVAQRVQEKLQAYHAALADAANKAATDGRFLRMPSTTSTARSVSVYSNGKTPAVPSADGRSHYSRNEDGEAVMGNGDLNRSASDETTHSRVGHPVSFTPPRMSFDFGFDSGPLMDDHAIDDIGIDDDLDDDDIVAAANAEALASDDEGFYGSEFGFYAKARPNSGGDLQAIIGGYFGPDGYEGLMRKKSLKEPNLTPITERSEFSTRNSFIGPGMNNSFGPPSAGGWSAMSSAGARLPASPWVENEITSIEQLRKLRAHAFSGSNGSLHSDGRGSGYFAGSGGVPMSFQNSTDSYSSGSSNPSSAHPQSSALQQQVFDSPHSAASSGHLPFSVGAADTEATPRRSLPHSNNHPGETPVTARKVTHKPGRTHSRNSSGADSVTYVREQDPDGGGPPRWVLERRRTSEQGLSELVAREVVQGGWI